jgi:hypothetical protein
MDSRLDSELEKLEEIGPILVVRLKHGLVLATYDNRATHSTRKSRRKEIGCRTLKNRNRYSRRTVGIVGVCVSHLMRICFALESIITHQYNQVQAILYSRNAPEDILITDFIFSDHPENQSYCQSRFPQRSRWSLVPPEAFQLAHPLWLF